MTQQRIGSFSSNVTSPGFRRRVVARQTKGRRGQAGFGTASSRRADRRVGVRRSAIRAAAKRRDIASGRRTANTPKTRADSAIRSFHRRSETQGVKAARDSIRTRLQRRRTSRVVSAARSAARRKRSRVTGRFIK